MPTFNIYDQLLSPIGIALQSDARFSGINIFYDRTEERVVPRDKMPAINYFIRTPWQDIGRGSHSASLQTRRTYITIGFGVWVYDAESQAALDQQLFAISGDLADFLRGVVDFDSANGIYLRQDTPMTFDLDYSTDDGGFVGTHLVSAPFEFYSGPGK